MEWDCVLPFTRPLSLNDRMHHMAKAKAVREWRSATLRCLQEVDPPIAPCDRIRVTLSYVPAQNRRRDPDNLVASMKPVVDALVDAGIVPDDTQDYVERVWPLILPAEPKREGGRFLLRVTRLA